MLNFLHLFPGNFLHLPLKILGAFVSIAQPAKATVPPTPLFRLKETLNYARLLDVHPQPITATTSDERKDNSR